MTNDSFITRVVVIIMALVLIFMIVDRSNLKRTYSKLLDKEINRFKEENRVKQLEYEALELQRDSYRELSRNAVETIRELKKQSNKVKDEIDKIPDDVAAYHDARLDSILSNYRHVKRTKNRGSFNFRGISDSTKRIRYTNRDKQ